MICGFCSREQNYRPEDCGICHSSLIKKAGSGFWEGGKGTRDKSRMSRKGIQSVWSSWGREICVLVLTVEIDPRKYKGRPGGAARKVKAGGTAS